MATTNDEVDEGDNLPDLIDDCLEVFKRLCHKLKRVSNENLAGAIAKLGLDVDSLYPVDDILDEMTRTMKNIAEENKSCLIDFTLSHDPRTVELFRAMLTNFICTYCQCRFQTSAELSEPNERRVDYLISRTLGHEIEIRDPQDFKENFISCSRRDDAPQYILRQLEIHSKRIKFDTRTEYVPQEDCHWHGNKNQRKVITVCTVFSSPTLPTFLTSTSLMPTVYARCVGGTGWQSSDFHDLNDGKIGVTSKVEYAAFPSWINKNSSIKNGEINLYEFLHKNVPRFQPGQHLDKYVVYYLVVHDNRFATKCPKEHQHSAFQIYVGKAKNGIKDRWLTNGGSHCKDAMMMFDALNDCTNVGDYWNRVNSIQLVDAYLLLSRYVTKSDMALFVVYQLCTGNDFNDEMRMNQAEKNLITDHGACKMRHGLNCRR